MERRSFLLAALGLAGSAVAGGLLVSKAEATPLDQLRNFVPQADDEAGAEQFRETPDGTAIEDTQYYGAPRPRYRGPPPRAYGNRYRNRYDRPYRRGPRVRCRMVRDRRGRLVRRCY